MNKVYPTLVVSTMSSGKSTLINAIVGSELLPSMNRACTARAVAILDNDMKSNFEVHCRKKKEEKQSKEEDGYRDSSKKCLIDFGWLLFVGLQIGLTKTDVQRESFWRMQELVLQWKRQQNAVTKQCVWNIDE